MRKLEFKKCLALVSMLAFLMVGITPVVAVHAGTAESIWPNTATPARIDSTDVNSVELGVKFTTAVSGTITGVRFYKATANTGRHVGHLWSSSGTKLAEVVFSGESSSGWQTASFITPVAVTAGTTYIASYFAPAGHYSVDNSVPNPHDPNNLSTAVSSANGDITALASGTSGGNGIFSYTTATNGAFPTATYQSSNYWVDILFNPGGVVPEPTSIYSPNYVPGTAAFGDAHAVSLGVQFQSQTAGYINGVRFYKGASNTGTHVGSLWTSKHTLLAQATFTSETSSGWQEVRFADPVPIAANTTYIASYFAPNGHYAFTSNGLLNGITNIPLIALPSSTPGGNGIFSYGAVPQVPTQSVSGNDYAVDIDYSPTYTAPTITQSTPRIGVAGNGSVLVLTDPMNHFSDDYCNALLQTRGIACAATDTGNLTAASVLTPYHTVVLADGAPLTASQVILISNWVSTGGNFIAMKPATNLSSLLGINTRQDILPDAYIKIDNSSAPGSGIDGQTLQYHGVADEHSLAGARAVAMLYSDVNTATIYPAVTTISVGSGTASAWMFDLAKSVVYTREGNPGLAGQAPASAVLDSNPRVSDRFALGYLDVSKAAVPQADLQVTLLANQIETTAFPVPMEWAFPSYKPGANHPGGLLKAAIILTGDDHAAGQSQTLNRFASETAASPAGCSVAAWTCLRSTSYAYAGAFSDAQAKPYTDAGFEVSPHISNNSDCASGWSTQAQLETIFGNDLNGWRGAYPTISAAHPPVTERLHCYGIWDDYATVAKEEALHGIQADMNSPCWPNSLFNVAQCMFTGSGFPQNIADSDGTLTGVNQFATQATDENPTTVSQAALNTLITNATGPNNYYGYFTVLAHLDNLTAGNQAAAAVANVAAANDVPTISGAQAQAFWAARAATKISNPAFSANAVTFSVATPAANLLLLQPSTYAGKTLTSITANSTAIAFGTQIINGISYAVFPVSAAGTYTATYN